MNDQPAIKSVPAVVWLLGLSGLLPFVGLTLALAGVFAGPDHWDGFLSPEAAGEAQLTYAAIILSFMGGAQWGLSMRAPSAAAYSAQLGYAVSVLPALLAWFAILLSPPAVAMLIMAAGFCALLAFDIMTVRSGVAPAWYPVLRFPLTIVVTLSLIVSAYFVSL